ncbi:hypothetical protein M1555_01840 [Patescibacteria group bacterium]|nr:hypothetical protein [Patescibacteria group bacterium]
MPASTMTTGRESVQPGEEIWVAEYLPRDEPVTNQPPMTWILETDELVPSDLFSDYLREEGEGRLFWAVARTTLPGFSVWDTEKERRYARGLIQCFSREFRNVATGIYILNRVTDHVRTYYPYLPEYLMLNWVSQPYFNKDGHRRLGSEPAHIKTYAAFAAQQQSMDARSRFIGLGDVLPRTYAAADDVREAVDASGKPRENRFFRLVRSSEAMQ